MGVSRVPRYFAPCPRGLEAALAQELTGIGAGDLLAVPGGVSFSGDLAVGYRANLESRLASRVLRALDRGVYRGEQDLYALVKAIDWPRWFTVDRTLRVDVTAIDSPLKSLEFATLRIKDAVCDRFRAEMGARPSVDTRTPDVRIQVFLAASEATVYLDLSGEPLFKRGWRTEVGEAPLRENLAAGLLALAGWQPGTVLLDPMCGSGTIPIEAAQRAIDRAPGLERAFGFERLRDHDAGLWASLVAQARSRVRRPVRALRVFGSDREGAAIVGARANAARAGVAEVLRLEVADVRRRLAPAATGMLLANIPYGVRLETQASLEPFYPQLGAGLKANFAGWSAWLLSPDRKLPGRLGLRATRRTPVFNGAIECRLFEFRMVAGSNRGRDPDASTSSARAC
jgi:putative N6-adenine-specific DNA methylase